ncbi:hypothetical protein [Paraburkholderia fungorum]|uniref:hypothetical protein n=1 Tax=Paraburkholderia fungorum TaxID=134537 RepID=UPI001C1EB2CB|nr:hypothetical protein [Paraburkholderia fungorum]MBU7442153.1 hypothetical protein [Paraburkholderia fungorum]
MTKPVFQVDIATTAQSSLDACVPLALTADAGCFHNAQNLRMPMGIYNISTTRVCDKLIRLCRGLETYFKAFKSLDEMEKSDEMMQEVVDYIELSLYAAAEHVDDVESIASGFFKNRMQRDKHVAYRRFVTELKKNKRLVSAAANAMKHQQARIRLFSMEFAHGASSGCLHGYFIEGVESGAVGPSSTFHKGQNVFSITTLVWEIIVFLLSCSRDLAIFLNDVATQITGPPASTQFPMFSKAVASAARLPTYTFGEEHPFSRVTLHLRSDDGNGNQLELGLYGSIKRGWSKTARASFARHVSRFAGDGKTKSFRLVQPKTVVLHHWD